MSSGRQYGSSLPPSIGSVEHFERVHVQRDYVKSLAAFSHWNVRLELQSGGSLLRFRLSVNNWPAHLPPVSIGVYGARNRAPSHTKYDFAQLLHNPSDSNGIPFNATFGSSSAAFQSHDFVQFLDKGVWFVSLFNDQDRPLELALFVQPAGMSFSFSFLLILPFPIRSF
jgi:hypothetical protein